MRFSFFYISVVLLSFLASCGGGGGTTLSLEDGKPVRLTHSSYLTMTDFGEATEVKIRNPWDTTKLLHTYLLIDHDAELPVLPDPATTIVRVPLRRSVVYSGVHSSLIRELGHLDAVAGICDADYLTDSIVRAEVKGKRIADCGNNMMPNMERIMRLSADGILLSPYESNNDYSKFSRMGIPVIECADYMEQSPLGRAEWMKFYGRLYGETARADSMFAVVEREYMSLKDRVGSTPRRPAVLMDRIYGNAWYIPEKYSTTGRFIEDAGGRNPFDYRRSSGSAPLASEEVLLKAGDADIWLIRHAGEKLSYAALEADNPVYSRFAAFNNQRVYTADTNATGIFDDAAFHPQWLLADMISLLHPELSLPDSIKHYYRPLR